MQRKIIRVTAVLCVALFVYFIIRAHPRELLRVLGHLTWAEIAALVLLRLAFWGIRTWSWQLVLGCCSPCRAPFATLFWAEMAGHAVGHFTPSAKIGGDAIRAMMVSPVPKNHSLASVVVDKTVELMATVLMMGLGLFLTLMRIRMGSTQRAVFLSLTVGMAAAILVLFRKQRKGLFIWVLESLKRLRIRSKYLESKRARLVETDAVIAEFYSRHRRVFLAVFLQYLVMIMLWAVEMHLSFRFLGLHSITFMKSFLITMLGIVANIVPVIPASIGIYDMSYLPIFAIFRVPLRFGITVVLLRRALNLLMAFIGLWPMLRLKQRPPATPAAGVPLPAPGETA